MKKLYLQTKRQQKGAVLLVALVMLLLLTIIGVASMRGTSLQENMANNLKERQLAFQGAEAALRAGERRAALERGRPTFDLLEEIGCPIISEDVDILGSGKKPNYTICMLGSYSEDPGLGGTVSDEILMLRIDAEGYGLAVDSSNQPVVTVKLRSTFRIEFD